MKTSKDSLYFLWKLLCSATPLLELNDLMYTKKWGKRTRGRRTGKGSLGFLLSNPGWSHPGLQTLPSASQGPARQPPRRSREKTKGNTTIAPMTLKPDKHVQARVNAATLLHSSYPRTFLAFNPRNSSDNVHCTSQGEEAGTLTKGCFSKKAYFLFMPSINSEILLQLISKVPFYYIFLPLLPRSV